VQTSDAQAGTFQPDLLFRGCAGSPLLGAAEGLAVTNTWSAAAPIAVTTSARLIWTHLRLRDQLGPGRRGIPVLTRPALRRRATRDRAALRPAEFRFMIG
jgi:hypothetical protein